jgi:rhomboid family GlyGly-CTERM serine protease
VRNRRGLIPVVAALLLAALLVQCLGDAAGSPLRYERAGLALGQWWRLLTAHIVHLGWSHLALNAGALGLITALLGEQFNTRQWLGVSLVSSLAVSLGLWWLSPQVGWYVGLSGMAHGLAAAGCMQMWLVRREAGGALGLVLLSGKLAWEQWHGAMPGSEAIIGGSTVVNAHLYGAVGGLLSTLLALATQPIKPRARAKS